MTKPTARGSTYTTMARCIRDSGRTTSNMGMGRKHGQMGHTTKASTRRARSTGGGSWCSQMAPCMKANLTIMTFTESEFMFGLITENTRASGRETRCTGRARRRGLTGAHITESMMCSDLAMRTIRSTVTVPSFGVTGGSTSESGERENSTGRGFSSSRTESRRKENGLMDAGLVGWTTLLTPKPTEKQLMI